MEALSLEEVSAAGELFFKSGVIASSRYMWSLAAQYYAEKFMYGKLIHVYERLARTVVSQVPNIDNTLEQAVNVGIPLGKFYRVWFHGGARKLYVLREPAFVSLNSLFIKYLIVLILLFY